jgi:hypothetical protein
MILGPPFLSVIDDVVSDMHWSEKDLIGSSSTNLKDSQDLAVKFLQIEEDVL